MGDKQRKRNTTNTTVDVVPTMPVWIRALIAGFGAIVDTVIATSDDVRAASVAFTTAARDVVDAPVPSRAFAGRFTGFQLRDGQNAIYVALAESGVDVNRITNGHIMAAWIAEYPGARCDFAVVGFGRGYGWSTLTEYINGRHGTVPGYTDDVARRMVTEWIANRARTVRVRTSKPTVVNG